MKYIIIPPSAVLIFFFILAVPLVCLVGALGEMSLLLICEPCHKLHMCLFLTLTHLCHRVSQVIWSKWQTAYLEPEPTTDTFSALIFIQICLLLGSFRIWLEQYSQVWYVLAVSRAWKYLWGIVLPLSQAGIRIISLLVWKVCPSMPQTTEILKFAWMYQSPESSLCYLLFSREHVSYWGL